MKKSDAVDGSGGFSEGAGPYQSDLEGKSAESPEQPKIDWRLDITDPSSGCDGTVDDRPHTIDRPARIKRGMMNRLGQDAVQHGTAANPKTTHVRMLIHPFDRNTKKSGRPKRRHERARWRM